MLELVSHQRLSRFIFWTISFSKQCYGAPLSTNISAQQKSGNISLAVHQSDVFDKNKAVQNQIVMLQQLCNWTAAVLQQHSRSVAVLQQLYSMSAEFMQWVCGRSSTGLQDCKSLGQLCTGPALVICGEKALLCISKVMSTESLAFLATLQGIFH